MTQEAKQEKQNRRIKNMSNEVKVLVKGKGRRCNNWTD